MSNKPPMETSLSTKYIDKDSSGSELTEAFTHYHKCFWETWLSLEKPLFLFCFFRLTNKNFHDAEDLARDTLLKAYESLNIADPETQLKAWLFKTARNTFYDQIRKNKTHEKYQQIETQVAFSEHDELLNRNHRSKLLPSVYQKLTELPQNQSKISLDYFIDEKGYREISEENQVSESYVRKIIFRTREKIKKEHAKHENLGTFI